MSGDNAPILQRITFQASFDRTSRRHRWCPRIQGLSRQQPRYEWQIIPTAAPSVWVCELAEAATADPSSLDYTLHGFCPLLDRADNVLFSDLLAVAKRARGTALLECNPSLNIGLLQVPSGREVNDFATRVLADVIWVIAYGPSRFLRMANHGSPIHWNAPLFAEGAGWAGHNLHRNKRGFDSR